MLPKKKKFRKDHRGKIREIRRETIADSLERVIKKEKLFDFKTNNEDIVLKNRWAEIVGQELSGQTTLKTFKNGNLIVYANNSIIIQELKMFGEKNLINELKTGVDIFAFKKIIFKLRS